MPHGKEGRVEALRAYDVLDSGPEESFDRVARLAANIFDVPVALVSLVDQDRHWFKACFGTDLRGTSRQVSLSAHSIMSDEVVVVPDATIDERFVDDPLRIGTEAFRFYAGAPLIGPGGHGLGTLCLLDRRPRDLDVSQRAVLADLAAIVVDELELRLATSRASEEIESHQRTMTMLRDREETLSTILEASPDLIVIADTDGRLRRVTRACEDLLGYTPDELIGLGIDEVLHPGDRDLVWRALNLAATGAERPNSLGIRAKHHDGHWVDLEVRGDLLDADGQILVLGIMRDVTHQRELEAELRGAKEAAESANVAKSEFLSRMSHELRTPLNVMLGFAQLMQDDGVTEQQQSHLEKILAAGSHLLTMIDEVLDLSAIESGSVALEIEPVDLCTVADEIISLVEPYALENGVSLEPCRPNPNWWIRGNAQRLTQVLLNLTSNAIKYNSRGGRVTISAEEKENGRIRLSVTDQGAGIQSDKLARLFVPFDRLGAEQSEIEGTGIGLPLSKLLVESMGGEIGVVSTPGEGSTFWCDFDLCSEVPPRSRKGSDRQTIEEDHVHKQATVIYVEDNWSNAELVKALLSKRRPDIRLLIAPRGGIGLELAQSEEPDLILLDLHLPDITGSEVLLRLKADPSTRDIPVFMTSADATPTRVRELRAAGADAYLTKPLDLQFFLEMLDRTLASQER